MKKYKILFSDLDGTLIKTISGSTFPQGIWDMKFRFDVLDKIKELKPDCIFIITNQGGIEKGFVDYKNFIRGKMAYIIRAIKEYTGIHCDYQYCKVNDKNFKYRKPNTGMLETAVNKNLYTQKGLSYDKSDMLMIGDFETDRQTAENFGIDYLDVEDFLAV